MSIEMKEFLFRKSLDELYEKHKDFLQSGDSTFEGILMGIAKCIRTEKIYETNETVISCLDSAIDGIEHAALDYYVSTK